MENRALFQQTDVVSQMTASKPVSASEEQIDGVYRRALELHRRNRLDDAAILYNIIISIAPNHAGAIHYLGVIASIRKDFVAAIKYFESAISLRGNKAFFYNNYGVALQELERPQDAENAFEKAIRLDPNYADAWSNLGKLHLDHARYEKAAKAIQRAIQIIPHHPDAIAHLVTLFQQTDQFSKAADLCFHYAKTSLGSPALLKKIGDSLVLMRCYRESLALHQKLEKTLPDDVKVLTNLGRTHGELGNFATSKKCYSKASKINGKTPLMAWYHLKYCPPVFQNEAAIDEYWKNLEQDLSDLLEENLGIDWRTTARDCVLPSFHLAHHGRSCREIRERFASIYRNAFSHERPEYQPKSRIRVGFVTSPGNEGGLLRGKAGLVRNLNPQRFESVVFCTKTSLVKCKKDVANDETEFVTLPDHFETAAKMMREAQCDILYYWKVEPGTWNPFFSMTRPAPIQCTGWGTYGTSGFDSIDYYLTTPYLEPENVDFERNYVERPEVFSTFPMYCQKDKPPAESTRQDFGLPEQGTLYFCPHRISKYHPSFDGIVEEILDRDPYAHLLLVVDKMQSTPFVLLRDRMQKNLGESLMRRVIFIENLPYEKYRSLLSLATIVLDSPVFTGGYTAYDSFSLGVPMVTMTGPINVQNFTAGFYKKMQLPEYINRSRDEYIETAMRLSRNEEERRQLSLTLLERSESLFCEQQAIHDFERFFEKAIQALIERQ